jgi:hypothetical protein
MSPEERDIVLEQSLATADNLRVALLIGMAFDDLRCRIVTRFAECLSTRLRERFGADAPWHVTNGIGVDGYLQPGGSLCAVRRVGSERVCVGLMYDKSPEIMYYSILKEPAPHPSRLNWGRVKQELDIRFAAGKTNPTCRWLSLVDHGYRNWYNPEVLLKPWEKDNAATYFTNRLAVIMGIVASVVQGK